MVLESALTILMLGILIAVAVNIVNQFTEKTKSEHRPQTTQPQSTVIEQPKPANAVQSPMHMNQVIPYPSYIYPNQFNPYQNQVYPMALPEVKGNGKGGITPENFIQALQIAQMLNTFNRSH